MRWPFCSYESGWLIFPRDQFVICSIEAGEPGKCWQEIAAQFWRENGNYVHFTKFYAASGNSSTKLYFISCLYCTYSMTVFRWNRVCIVNRFSTQLFVSHRPGMHVSRRLASLAFQWTQSWTYTQTLHETGSQHRRVRQAYINRSVKYASQDVFLIRIATNIKDSKETEPDQDGTEYVILYNLSQ